MDKELNHGGDCSIWISPVCDCGVLRKAISEGKTVLVNGASAASQWAAHLTAIDKLRHAFARFSEPDELSPGSVITNPNLEAPPLRTIADEVAEYERTKGRPSLLRALINKCIDLHCPHCHERVGVEVES